MTRKNKKVFFPKTRLAELLAQPGGVDREQAVADALQAVEAMRDDCVVALRQTIASIEAIVFAASGDELGHETMQEILTLSDRIITIAGTYGYAQLDVVARSLCDLIDGLGSNNSGNIAPIAVHVRALRLVAPGSPAVSNEAVNKMLAELARLLAHFGRQRNGTDAGRTAA